MVEISRIPTIRIKDVKQQETLWFLILNNNTIKHLFGDFIDEESKMYNSSHDDLWIADPDWFYYNDTLYFKNKLYSLGKENFNVFDLIKRKWSIVSNYEIPTNFLNSESSEKLSRPNFIKVIRTKLPLNLL